MVDLSDDRLAPGFLVAPPPLEDANFDRSVVLLAVHDDNGSMGFVINRESDIHLHSVFEDLELPTDGPNQRVLAGGPVSGYAGFVLYEHEADAPLSPGLFISPTISVSPSRDVLEAASRGELVGRFDLLLGYAGWGPGQLEDEMERGFWLHAGFEEELLFDTLLDERWDESYRRLGIHPSGFISVPGGAKA